VLQLDSSGQAIIPPSHYPDVLGQYHFWEGHTTTDERGGDRCVLTNMVVYTPDNALFMDDGQWIGKDVLIKREAGHFTQLVPTDVALVPLGGIPLPQGLPGQQFLDTLLQFARGLELFPGWLLPVQEAVMPIAWGNRVYPDVMTPDGPQSTHPGNPAGAPHWGVF
jgi:hypothetical protein